MLLEQELPLIVDKVLTVFEYESLIDLGEQLYLFTWCPNPAELPEASFHIQHLWAYPLVSDFLRMCKCGLACVETTQLGRPHYHGWYQLTRESLYEKMRIAIAKTLQRLGLLKITPSKGHIKINSWVQHANCLYYYKKDLIETQLETQFNPITPVYQKPYDFAHLGSLWVRDGKRQTVADIEEKISLKEFYKDFYSTENFDLPEDVY